jgi:hypothetical protein
VAIAAATMSAAAAVRPVPAVFAFMIMSNLCFLYGLLGYSSAQ